MAIINSFKYAFRGLREVVSTERNVKIHLLFAILAVVLSFLLKLQLLELLFVIISITVVLFAEIINTALEKTLDLISQENSHKVQLIKDMSAAAVLLTALNAIAVALVVFVPKIINFIGSLS